MNKDNTSYDMILININININCSSSYAMPTYEKWYDYWEEAQHTYKKFIAAPSTVLVKGYGLNNASVIPVWVVSANRTGPLLINPIITLIYLPQYRQA